MITRSMVAVLAGSIGFLGLGSLFAHPDDPKERDRQPRYEGPAWRLDIDGHGDTPGPAFPSQNIQLMSWLPLGEFGNHTSGNSVWGYVSPGKREYAIMGLSGGTGFVDVTNPGNAQIVAVLSGPTSTWRDMKTYGQYAYAISEGGSGIQVFDLSRIDEGIVTHVNTVLTGGTAATHTLAVNEQSGYLYRAGGGSNGIRIYSLADPANPVLVNQYTERYTHEATVVTYTEGPYAGREIAFLCGGFNGGWNQTGLTILDVTDKQNLQVLAHLQYSDNNYSHQGWPSADMRYFYLNDELDEQNVGFTTRTRIIDISNLNNPTEAGWFTNGLRAVDHNLYVLGNLIFESNYRSGLRVFDNSADPLNPVEIAYFDTYPDNDNPNFNGLWNNYPFLPSGTILGSDIERGLFVWRLVLPLLAFDYPDGRPDLVDPHGGTRMLVQVSADRETPQPGTGVLHVSVNGGDFVEFPMTHLGNHLYEATFPEAPCGSTVRYYVSAETTRGTRFTNPIGAPADAFSAVAAVGFATLFSDPFQTDQGWTVQNVQLTDGAWERGVPAGDGSRGDPTSDFDGSGACYLTGNRAGNSDVDGGPTRLLSPVIDLSSAPEAEVSYARWFTNDDRDIDRLDTHISNDGGQTWVLVSSVGHFDGWQEHAFRVADFVTPTNQVRLRFSATDNPNDSVTEAAIDAVRIRTIQCDSTVLTGFTVSRGTLMSGTLDDLRESDDASLRVKSGFGNTFTDLHSMFLRVDGETTNASPAEVDVRIETRISHQTGIGRVMMQNWNTSQFEQVGTYAVGQTDVVANVNGLDAGKYVRAGDGRVRVQIRHIVVVPVFAFTFDTWVDQVRFTVR